MTHELLLGPIVGGLSSTSAYLWGRISPPQNGEKVLYAWTGLRGDLSDAQLSGQSLPLAPEQGYAGVAPASGLKPETRYYYALTLKDTPPSHGTSLLDGGVYPSFQTFPHPGKSKSFCFAFGSCFRPENENSGLIFRALQRTCLRDDLRFILMIGDQVYSDDGCCNGLGKAAKSLAEYRAVYQFAWSNPNLRRLFLSLPVFMTLDDHEVENDWYWQDVYREKPAIPWWERFYRLIKGLPPQDRQLTLEHVQNALQAYWEHQAMHAPPMSQPLPVEGDGKYALTTGRTGSLAYTFEFGKAAFFVLDTRTMRVKGRRQHTMLGAGQWQQLEEWLLTVKDSFQVKFIVTSCSLLFQMWVDIPRDRWVGFPQERDRLLNFIAANDIQGLYLLAGDLHSAHAVRVELFGPQGKSLPLWEFCASPFEQNPNRLAKYTRIPLFNGLCKTQQVEFIVDERNYGVVHVDFGDDGVPAVQYKLYGETGKLLAKVNCE